VAEVRRVKIKLAKLEIANAELRRGMAAHHAKVIDLPNPSQWRGLN
jgi:hypothetical protein